MSGSYTLIITGNMELARRYHQALRQAGFAAQVVATGAQAQVALAFTNPDVIVLDLDLPDMPGEVVLRQVQAQTRLKQCGLIVIGVSSKKVNKKIEYLHDKPLNAADLVELAGKLCLAST